MINFTPTTYADRVQILQWITLDPYHTQDASEESVDLFLTDRDNLLSCAVKDEEGIVFYLQLRQEGELVRIGTQFGPEDQVSKKRVVEAIKDALVSTKVLVESAGAEGFVYESVSPSLIKFMSSFGFVPL
jgi:hypothetical protein